MSTEAEGRVSSPRPGPNEGVECDMCGSRCWNDHEVSWLGRSWGDRYPFCVANGCAARQERILARAVCSDCGTEGVCSEHQGRYNEEDEDA